MPPGPRRIRRLPLAVAANGQSSVGWRRNGAGMLRCVAGTSVVEDLVVAVQDDLDSAAPMELSHRISPAGEAVVELGGDLDILSAEVAISYFSDVIDRHQGPVAVNLAALAFCDARGLAALVRMARYAEQKGCPFRLASPSPSLVKIMRMTGLHRRFLGSQASALGQLRPD